MNEMRLRSNRRYVVSWAILLLVKVEMDWMSKLLIVILEWITFSFKNFEVTYYCGWLDEHVKLPSTVLCFNQCISPLPNLDQRSFALQDVCLLPVLRTCDHCVLNTNGVPVLMPLMHRGHLGRVVKPNTRIGRRQKGVL